MFDTTSQTKGPVPVLYCSMFYISRDYINKLSCTQWVVWIWDVPSDCMLDRNSVISFERGLCFTLGFNASHGMYIVKSRILQLYWGNSEWDVLFGKSEFYPNCCTQCEWWRMWRMQYFPNFTKLNFQSKRLVPQHRSSKWRNGRKQNKLVNDSFFRLGGTVQCERLVVLILAWGWPQLWPLSGSNADGLFISGMWKTGVGTVRCLTTPDLKTNRFIWNHELLERCSFTTHLMK